MDTNLYSQDGKSLGKLTLPSRIFSLPWNADLVHQVVVSMQSSARNSIAHTKTRGEVRGGGKKPWKQKGTGRARHGSTRSPIWVGGGVTHGPRSDKNYDKKVNRKMKTKALFTILSKKYKDGEITFIDDLTLKEPKTKEALASLKGFSNIPALKTAIAKKSNALFIAVPEKKDFVSRGFNNIGNVSLEETRNINPVSILSYKHLVFIYPEETFRILESKLGGDSEVKDKPTKPAREKKVKKEMVKVKKIAKAKK